MTRQIPRPPSIEDIGLEMYLERTKDEHNDNGYAEFVRLLTTTDEFDARYPKSKIAHKFNVSRKTIYTWIAIYNKGIIHD